MKDLIKSPFSYTEVANANGSYGVTIPSDWKELNIAVYFANNPTFLFTFHVIRQQYDNKSGSDFNVVSGQYNGANDYNSVIVTISPTSVKLYRYTYNGTDYKTTCPLKVYYR